MPQSINYFHDPFSFSQLSLLRVSHLIEQIREEKKDKATFVGQRLVSIC